MNQGLAAAVSTSRSFLASSAPELSVMLPTCNRADVLMRTLSALEQQTADKRCHEIIVVDDGSGDATPDVLRQFADKTGSRFCCALLKQNGGPAKARNVGLSLARGKIVLIIGDDIEPTMTMVEQHLQFHQKRPDEREALLGHVSFPEELPPTPFMRWLEQGGRRYFFNYADLKAGQEAEPMFFYTCNVSVKNSLLKKSGWFDESFPHASHEDLELGCRLAEQGMRLFYDPAVAGWHWHPLTVQGIVRRIYLMGFSAKIFWSKTRQQDNLGRQAVRRMLAQFCATSWGVLLWNRLRREECGQTHPARWHLLLFLSFFIGLADASGGRPVRL